jgi:hypothetical protein
MNVDLLLVGCSQSVLRWCCVLGCAGPSGACPLNIFQLCTTYCRAALSLHYTRTSLSTGVDCCAVHMFAHHTTNCFAEPSFQCCCHCTSTYPLNDIWPTSPRTLLRVTHTKRAVSYQKVVYLTTTEVILTY